MADEFLDLDDLLHVVYGRELVLNFEYLNQPVLLKLIVILVVEHCLPVELVLEVFEVVSSQLLWELLGLPADFELLLVFGAVSKAEIFELNIGHGLHFLDLEGFLVRGKSSLVWVVRVLQGNSIREVLHESVLDI